MAVLKLPAGRGLVLLEVALDFLGVLPSVPLLPSERRLPTGELLSELLADRCERLSRLGVLL